LIYFLPTGTACRQYMLILVVTHNSQVVLFATLISGLKIKDDGATGQNMGH